MGRGGVEGQHLACVCVIQLCPTRNDSDGRNPTYVCVSGDVLLHSPAAQIFGDELGARGWLDGDFLRLGFVVGYTIAVNIVARYAFAHL